MKHGADLFNLQIFFFLRKNNISLLLLCSRVHKLLVVLPVHLIHIEIQGHPAVDSLSGFDRPAISVVFVSVLFNGIGRECEDEVLAEIRPLLPI